MERPRRSDVSHRLLQPARLLHRLLRLTRHSKGSMRGPMACAHRAVPRFHESDSRHDHRVCCVWRAQGSPTAAIPCSDRSGPRSRRLDEPRSPRARDRNAAIVWRVTGAVGQNRSLAGGLQPRVIPAAASFSMSRLEDRVVVIGEVDALSSRKVQGPRKECSHRLSRDDPSGTELVVRWWVAAKGDSGCGKLLNV